MSIERNDRSGFRREAFINKPEQATERQLTLRGRYKQNDRGTEMITFTLRLGFVRLVFIVNIPQVLFDEKDRRESDRPIDEAPVYVKFQIEPPRPDDEDVREDRDENHEGE